MAAEVVRRSSRDEVLERIVAIEPKGASDSLARNWARDQLNFDGDPGIPRVDCSPEDQVAILVKYGYRPQRDLKTESIEEFVKWVNRAYFDSHGYPEYGGIKIDVSVDPKTKGSSSMGYEVKATFDEVVGLNDPNKYSTSLIFDYQHDHTDGLFDSSVFIEEQLKNLQSILLSYLNPNNLSISVPNNIRIQGNSLLVDVEEDKE